MSILIWFFSSDKLSLCIFHRPAKLGRSRRRAIKTAMNDNDDAGFLCLLVRVSCKYWHWNRASSRTQPEPDEAVPVACTWKLSSEHDPLRQKIKYRHQTGPQVRMSRIFQFSLASAGAISRTVECVLWLDSWTIPIKF